MTRLVTLCGYAVLVLWAVATEFRARRRGATASFGDSLSAVMRRPPLRLAIRAFWLWVGWHLFVRAS